MYPCNLVTLQPEIMQTSSTFRFFFIKTIFSTLLLILMILGGFIAYQSLVKEANPDLKIPMATIITTWPGSSPELVEKEITINIEKNIKTLSGVKRYFSSSRNSVSALVVEFDADAPLEESMQLLRTKVNEAESEFPEEAEKPSVQAIAVSDIPIVTFILYGDLDDALLDKQARSLKDQLEIVPGIRKVEISGSRKEVVIIQLIPSVLTDLGISPIMVKNRIMQANIDMPWGKFEHPNFNTLVELKGQFRDVETLKALPITRLTQGRVIRLGEIAHVRQDLEAETTRTSVSVEGEDYRKAVSLSLYKSPGEDTINVIERAKEAIANAEQSAEWPHTLHYMVVSDESDLIWEGLTRTFTNIWQAMLAVFIILFVMLSWREALIAGLSIPLTFLGALVVVWSVGYTLNEMVIIGMILALGLLVDDFILVMEGMHDALGKGLTLQQSQIYTLKTYAIPSLSGSLTTILALTPLMAIGGIGGKFIRIIPATAVICLVLSYLISMVVDVPLAPVILKKRVNGHPKLSKADRLVENVSGRLCRWLQHYAVRSKPIAILWCVGTVVIFIVSLMAFGLVPAEMYPKGDGRNFGISIELTPDADLEQSQEVADRVGEVLRQKKYFENITKYVGMKSPFSSTSLFDSLAENQATYLLGFSCLFVPEDQRDKLAYEYVEELRHDIEAELQHFPGALLTLTAQTGGGSAEDPIQFAIIGNDMDMLRQISQEIQGKLTKVPGATDIRDTLGSARVNWWFTPRHEALDFYGINEVDLASQARIAMVSDKIGEFTMPGTKDNLDILLGMTWPSRQGEIGGPKKWEELFQVNIFNQEGKPIPAYDLLEEHVDQAPLSITHKNGRRSITIMAKTAGRTAGEILKDFIPELDKMQQTWPGGYSYQIAGEAEEMEETFGSAGKALIVAFILVFSILALLFDSFRQPFIIMFSVPFALIGVFAGFFLAWIPMSFSAFIGIISLVGIAVNDAIVLIETMNNHRRNGLSVKEAAARGVGDRLRPILSTTITTTVGLTPLALSDPVWMPLCNAIIFGLIASTLICLFVIPCLYLLLTPDREVTVPG
jgi:multidrug efflux pump subunit AcrB